jgi:hypothetical protein
MVPLFPGMPGGIELLVIFVMMLMLFGVPVVVVLLGGAAWLRSNDASDERIEELEEEVEQLRANQSGESDAEPASSDDSATGE